MIKGINKQILEVTNTDNPYFERVIFFVRPQSAETDEQLLKKEAEKIAATAQRPPKTRKTFKQRLTSAFFLLLGAGAALAMTYVVNNLIN